MKFQDIVRCKRRELGLTQEQAARRLGVSPAAVSKWESGQSLPDTPLFAPLARLLHTDLNTLLSFEEEPEPARVAQLLNEVARLLQEVNHPGLALMLDPTLNSIFDVLDQYIRVAHAKDCKRAVNTGTKFGDGGAEHNSFRGAGAVELPGAGLGVLNYELYLTRLKKNHPNIPIIIEHIDESDIPRAKKFVDDTLKKVGA